MSEARQSEEVQALMDCLALAERHRGMGDYIEAYLGLRSAVEVFLAAAPKKLPQAKRLQAGVDFPCAIHHGPKGDCNEANCRCN